MGTCLTDGEAHGLPLLEFAQSFLGAQGGAPAQDDHEFLVGVMEVVGVGHLAGWKLPEAGADEFGADLVADAGTVRAKALWALALLEGRAVDVGRDQPSIAAHLDGSSAPARDGPPAGAPRRGGRIRGPGGASTGVRLAA